ncbi:hypothetical protein SAR116_0331 [Candidatus Puniceispirillum marinum IMCC1322]|uniref:Uncharacterized protein n=1 Tax=Puniceispirillum marinum (strain IMCC1322) TaxID=488538 RepID=D5BQ76_PUNMI|nr:hypothetical protein SAR116_0331 [Candidatus Puniceispirillum marinum IMCC1322]
MFARNSFTFKPASIYFNIGGLGIIDSKGKLGRIGGGIFDPPMVPFHRALTVLEDA